MVDALVWSVGPLKKSEIQSLASMLPKLVRSLLRGMTTVAMPNDARHAFFNQLMETHTQMINESKARTAEAIAEAAAAAAAADEASAAAAPLAEFAEEAAPAGGSYHLHTVMALERGTVLQFIEGSETVRAKLSWVSPKQTRFLFTSVEHGARQFTRDLLAEQLEKGQAGIVDASVQLMDRVLQAVVGPPSVA